MATCTHGVTDDGFDFFRLYNDSLSVSVLPQLGGKIAELTDLRSGREWLWRNPHLARRLATPGMDYEREMDSGGWDEVLFSVKPCTVDLPDGGSLSVADHGEVVGIPWQVTESGIDESGAAVIETVAKSRDPAFIFRRRITLGQEQPGLDIHYTLENNGPLSWPWLWCAHPLIAVEPGMKIALAEGSPMRQEGEPDGGRGDQAWPLLRTHDDTSLDLSGVFGSSNRESGAMCAKLYVRSVDSVSVVCSEDGDAISMQFDADELPWLGLWINNRGWSGCGSEPYLNLGLEPATAAFDFLGDAMLHGQAKVLAPGETSHWSLAVQLAQAGG